MTDLVLGASARAAARKHKVSHTTVQRWAEDVSECATKRDIGDLIEEHLRNEIRTLGAVAEHAQDKAWLSKQSAGELGTLYGIIADKAHRVLAAMERARQLQEGQRADGRGGLS